MQNITTNPQDVVPVGSKQAKDATMVHSATKASGGDVIKSNNDVDYVDRLQDSANQAHQKYMDAIKAYKTRTNTSANQASRKSVVLNDGTTGYVNALGYFQPYMNAKETQGKNMCPDKKDEVSFNVNNMSMLTDIYGSVYLSDKRKQPNTGCGMEGDILYVGNASSSSEDNYQGCYKFEPGSMKALMNPGTSEPLKTSYNQCMRYANNNGYSVFGLQQMNQRGDSICLLGNNFPLATNGGEAKAEMKKRTLWLANYANKDRKIKLDYAYWKYYYIGKSATRTKEVSIPNGYVLGPLAINPRARRVRDTFRVSMDGPDSAGPGRTRARVTRADRNSGWGMTLHLPLFLNDQRLRPSLLFMAKRSNKNRIINSAKRGKIRISKKGSKKFYLSRAPEGIHVLSSGQLGFFYMESLSYTSRKELRYVSVIPKNIPNNPCNQSSREIKIIGATYGSNCTTNKREIKQNNRLSNLQNALKMAVKRKQDPSTFGFIPANRMFPYWLRRDKAQGRTGSDAIGINNDPAPGCYKDFLVNWKCGSYPKVFSKKGWENRGMTIDCGNEMPCSVVLELAGLNESKEPGLYLYFKTEDNTEYIVFQVNFPLLTRSVEAISEPDKNVVKNAKYVGVMNAGNGMKKDEYLASRDGRVSFSLIDNGRLTISVHEENNPCVTGPDGALTTMDKKNVALYSLNNVNDPSVMGKVGYVDRTGVLHEYKNNVLKPVRKYDKFQNESLVGHDLSGKPFTGSESDCMRSCNYNDKCFGYTFEKQTNTCYLKNNQALRNTPIPARGSVFARRGVKIDKSQIGKTCDFANFRSVPSSVWNSYPPGGAMKKNTPCDYEVFLQSPQILELKKDWEKKRDFAENEQQRLGVRTTIMKLNIQNSEKNLNTSTANNHEYIYGDIIDSKIPSAMTRTTADSDKVEAFTGKIQKTAKLNPQEEIDHVSQRKRGVGFKNIQGIVNDTTLIVNEHSMKFFAWSAFAMVFIILATRIMTKINKAK